MFTDIVRKYDQTYLKIFGRNEDKKIMLVKCRSVKTSGLDSCAVPRGSRGAVNDEKLYNNICRAKNAIYELAFCNPWEYFVTLTLDKRKFARDDIKKFSHAFSLFIRNQYLNKGFPVKYLLVPELHADKKSWHLHGFISGLPESDIKAFAVGDKMGKYIAGKVLSGDSVYNWLSYSARFGFCDLEPIKNTVAVSKYITKYINKALFESKSRFGCHLYYCSQGLRRAVVVCSGSMDDSSITYDFQNEYCAKKEMPFSADLLECLKNQFYTIDYHKTRENAVVPAVVRNNARRLRAGVRPVCARQKAYNSFAVALSMCKQKNKINC